jgi:hypothetical protein
LRIESRMPRDDTPSTSSAPCLLREQRGEELPSPPR